METINFDTKTVGEMVAHNPKAASVFRKLNIDFCCGGNKKLYTERCEGRSKIQRNLGRGNRVAI